MTVSLDVLLEEVSREHFPYPPATPEEIEHFERQAGWRLDPDLRAFYLHCNGAELIERLPDTPYRILPLAKVVPARVAIYGEDEDTWGPRSVFALCDVQDGNYVLVDTGQQENGRYPLLDGDHEAWPDPAYCKRIACCFAEFLEQILRTRRSLYWLGE